MTATETITDASQFLSFSLGSEQFAIGILYVKEIIEYGTLTRVPGMPPSIAGVINLRGGVVPVVDLAVRFGLPASTITRRTCIVVLELPVNGESVAMGIVADAVSQVLDLTADDIAPPPGFGSHVRSEYLHGMAKAAAGGKFVMLLDIERTLAVEELIAGATAAAGELQVQAASGAIAGQP